MWLASLRILLFVALALLVFHALMFGAIASAAWLSRGEGSAFGVSLIHDWMSSNLMMVPGLLAILVPTQLWLLTAAVLGARASTGPAREAFGLGPIRKGPMSRHWILMSGSIFVLMINARVGRDVMASPVENLALVNLGLSRAGIVGGSMLLLAGVVLPVLGEELLLRGYVLKRLLNAWNPWAAVLCASAFSALFQVSPEQAGLAILPATYCGVVAWRCGSATPALLCRGSYGLCAGLLALGGPRIDLDSGVANVLVLPLVLGLILAFIAAIVLLLRAPRVPERSAHESAS